MLPSLRLATRSFASSARLYSANATPWFVDPEPTVQIPKPQAPQSVAPTATPLPDGAPSIVHALYSELRQSPHLDHSQLAVGPAVLPPPGPALPLALPRGRRRRGGTYAGESNYDKTNGVWDWVIRAQVKEGTESRGAVDAVLRLVRKTILSHEPPVPIAPRSRRQSGSEWVMVDGGTFAVHILSKAAREKYFNPNTHW